MSLPNKLISLDNTVFSCLYRDEEPQSTDPGYRVFKDCETLMAGLVKQDYKIIIPTVVLAESYCVFDEAKQNKCFNDLKSFGLIMVDFTETTSRILARLLHRQYASRGYQGKNIAKAQMKYDMFILASAIENGCDCFYTTDSDFDIYNEVEITIKKPPNLPPSYQAGTLFEGIISPASSKLPF